jgi:hypothetical protein
MIDEVLITVAETDEACAIQAESLYLAGVRPITIHRTSSESADAVARYLRARPNAVPVRRSPDNETAEEFKSAIEAERDTVHVYFERVCDVCGALPPLFHTSLVAGFFCRRCAEVVVGGNVVKTPVQS